MAVHENRLAELMAMSTKKHMPKKYVLKENVIFGGLPLFLIHCMIYRKMIQSYPVLNYRKRIKMDDLYMILVIFSQSNWSQIKIEKLMEITGKRRQSVIALVKRLEQIKFVELKNKGIKYRAYIVPGEKLKFITRLYNRLTASIIKQTREAYGDINWKYFSNHKNA